MQWKIISRAVECNWTEEEIRRVCEKNDVSFDEVINNVNRLRMINERTKEITLKKHEEISDLVMAKTHGAAQRNWQTPSEFPCCPSEPSENPILKYATNLKNGAIFSSNCYGDSIVLDSVISGESILIMTNNNSESSIKPWAVAKITYEDKLYIHESLGSFFSQEGAEKEFYIAQGLEWTGGDSIDDYC